MSKELRVKANRENDHVLKGCMMPYCLDYVIQELIRGESIS